jgi:hypothetical protein
MLLPNIEFFQKFEDSNFKTLPVHKVYSTTTDMFSSLRPVLATSSECPLQPYIEFVVNFHIVDHCETAGSCEGVSQIVPSGHVFGPLLSSFAASSRNTQGHNARKATKTSYKEIVLQQGTIYSMVDAGLRIHPVLQSPIVRRIILQHLDILQRQSRRDS